MSRLCRLFSLFLVGAAACSPAPTASPAPRAGPPPFTGHRLEALGAYHAIYEMHFQGDFVWEYVLETRSDGVAVEYRLHYEGLEAARSPGDVRLVVEADSSRMRGPGTDDECVLFPSDLDLSPVLIRQDDVLEPAAIGSRVEPAQIEPVAGINTIRYAAQADTAGGWRNVELEFWRDESTGAVLRSRLRAAGPDPYFDAGEGLLVTEFRVQQVGPQRIEPVAGCEIDLPLPADAGRLIRLPGLIGFDSPAAPEAISAFYQAALAPAGWAPAAEPQSAEGVILLVYQRGGALLEINIEAGEEGSRVELITGTE
jgi:hypothetical protein